MTETATTGAALRADVQDYYRAKAAQAQAGQACCGPDSADFGPAQYAAIARARFPTLPCWRAWDAETRPPSPT